MLGLFLFLAGNERSDSSASSEERDWADGGLVSLGISSSSSSSSSSS